MQQKLYSVDGFSPARVSILALLLGCAVVSGSAKTQVPPKQGTSTWNNSPNIQWHESLSAEIVPSAPSPDAENAMPGHGPFVPAVTAITLSTSGRDVSWYFGCEFGIEDDENNLWSWTYEAKLKKPDGSVFKSRLHWVDSSPSATDVLGETLEDPVEGTYTCTIDWWVDYTYLGQRQAQATLSYINPTGETSSPQGWWGSESSVHRWKQTLLGGNFSGRRVSEEDAGGGSDGCHYSGSPVNWSGKVSTENYLWPVGTDSTWGDDLIGWSSAQAAHYRAAGRAPCEALMPQRMVINRPGPGGVFEPYVTNTLKLGITDTTVYSSRAGQEVERIWP
jgi:hypothetical protein